MRILHRSKGIATIGTHGQYGRSKCSQGVIEHFPRHMLPERRVKVVCLAVAYWPCRKRKVQVKIGGTVYVGRPSGRKLLGKAHSSIGLKQCGIGRDQAKRRKAKCPRQLGALS